MVISSTGRAVQYFLRDNFKVHTDIGLSEKSMWRHLVVLDTGAGPNCIGSQHSLPDGNPALRTNRATLCTEPMGPR